uniref:Uncharacterized protein n=1 Tax=Rhizophora mucronata TaxID=61149 RepID=A0A2P2Q525_RHIMU
MICNHVFLDQEDHVDYAILNSVLCKLFDIANALWLLQMLHQHHPAPLGNQEAVV